MNSVVVAQQSFAHHAKSFRFASLFLPRKNINDIALLYWFCREIDDAVDEASTIEIAEDNLADFKAELLLQKEPRSSVEAVLQVCTKHHISHHTLFELMDGMRSDLQTVRIQSIQELGVYCYRVAGVVGEMMSPLLGVCQKEATPFAIDLGLGMQITNICRDIQEDFQRDRIYIPQDLMQKYHLQEQDFHNVQSRKTDIANLVNELLDMAESCYQRSLMGMQYIPASSRLGILIARRVYRAIGLKLQKNHQSNPFHGRTSLNALEKSWQALLGLGDFLKSITLGWSNPPPSPFYESYSDLQHHQMEFNRPPSTAKETPRIYAPAGETKKAIAPAVSSG